MQLRYSALSLLALAGLAGSASAGWEGVFRVTCSNCGSAPVVAGYSVFSIDPCNPCPPPPPRQVCVTQYTQRCFYQPEVSYRTQTYYEPVTSYRTSYYYEPITCTRYRCCYDPCICGYRQVAESYTSYRLRSQCCPVTNYVQRCCSVPVTTYRRCCYWEPQTCCSLIDPCTGAVISAPAAVPALPTVPAVPRVSDNLTPAVPAVPRVEDYRGNGTNLDRFNVPVKPSEGNPNSYRPNWQGAPAAKPNAPVVPKLDRIALDDGPSFTPARLVGTIVEGDGSNPKVGAEVVFQNDTQGRRETVTADSGGKFQVSLASGNWSVYVRNPNGTSVFHSKLTVRDGETQQMTLVSR